MARLISDCRSAGLVEVDGTVSWLCAPRFDAAPVFASALDDRAGFFSVLVEGGEPEAQRYIDGTLVCETDLRGPDGLVRVTDCLVIDPRGPAAADEAGELIRQIHVVEGRARVGIHRAALDTDPRAIKALNRCMRIIEPLIAETYLGSAPDPRRTKSRPKAAQRLGETRTSRALKTRVGKPCRLVNRSARRAVLASRQQ